jgi:hypothetical protein
MREQLIKYRWLWVVLIVAACLTFTTSGTVQSEPNEVVTFIMNYQFRLVMQDTITVKCAYLDSVYCQGYRAGQAIRTATRDSVFEYQQLSQARSLLPHGSLFLLNLYFLGMLDGELDKPNAVLKLNQRKNNDWT